MWRGSILQFNFNNFMARVRSTAIILGYSFVKWLRKDLSLHFKSRATANFGLAADVIVIMHGVSGRTV